MQYATYVKSYPSHKAHRAALISVFSAISQTPVYTARPRIRGQCIARCACLRPSLCWYSLHLPTEGWPGWVHLGGWLHAKMVYLPADGHRSKYETFIVPVLLYGSECWCLRKEDERRILTAEMTWLRRLLRVTRRDKMRNETVRGILCQETTLVDRIAERRLNWFGHVSRMGSERLPAKALQPRNTTEEMDGQCKWRYRSKEVDCTTGNGSGVGQKQMETSSSSLIIIDMTEESRSEMWWSLCV